jgi:hypothetical protein
MMKILTKTFWWFLHLHQYQTIFSLYISNNNLLLQTVMSIETQAKILSFPRKAKSPNKNHKSRLNKLKINTEVLSLIRIYLSFKNRSIIWWQVGSSLESHQLREGLYLREAHRKISSRNKRIGIKTIKSNQAWTWCRLSRLCLTKIRKVTSKYSIR